MLDPEIAAIDAAMKAQGRTRAELARLLSLDGSQVTRLFGGRRRLQRHEFKKAEEWLFGVTPGRTSATVVPLPNMVPLYGWVAAGSAEKLVLADQSMRGYVPMHPAQVHARDAFALEVSDVSMVPRYEPGEIVYLAPNRWPARGQDCVVVTKEGAGLLKRYVLRDESKLTLRQLNPERDVILDLDAVEAVHAVVGRS